MNLHRLQLFLAVAKHRSISRAAEALHISQPAVSAQMKRLERDTGVKLFWQTGRQIRLTEPGHVLLDYTERIIALFRETEETLKEYSELRRGRVRIAATTTPGIYLLPQLLGRLSSKYPNLRMEIEIGTSEQVLSQLDHFQQDLALVTEGVDDRRHLDVSPVMRDELIPVAAPSSSLTQASWVDPQTFGKQRLFLREGGSQTRKRINRHLSSFDVEPEDVTELPHNEAIKQAVIAGLGHTIISRLVVSKELTSGELVILNAPQLHIERPIVLVMRRDKVFAPIAQSFLENMRAEIRSLH